ncbi:hypothetical protein GSbR_05050 [Geobacter sp. SVR]|nr:hypothetical protein GSVR_09650 [Geobacter sp. SVR]GCF83905.1 hypothetical protein GSbR_05050 [Geobacter sp. SVR]
MAMINIVRIHIAPTLHEDIAEPKKVRLHCWMIAFVVRVLVTGPQFSVNKLSCFALVE